MNIEVEMCAFAGGKIRTVSVPDNEVRECRTTGELLDRVFHWGQNDLQPQQIPSVSVGDVIRLNGKRYQVAGVGFRELEEGENPDSPFSVFSKGDVE